MTPVRLLDLNLTGRLLGNYAFWRGISRTEDTERDMATRERGVTTIIGPKKSRISLETLMKRLAALLLLPALVLLSGCGDGSSGGGSSGRQQRGRQQRNGTAEEARRHP